MKNAFLCAAVVTLTCAFALGQVQYKVLYTFGTNGGAGDGANPAGPVIFDGLGDMFGTTPSGGGNVSTLCPQGCGTVFELAPSQGGWTEKLLHAFSYGADGMSPFGLIGDSKGNLYGVTGGQGEYGCQVPDCGTVYELSPEPDGQWSETILYEFSGGSDGWLPSSPLTFDSQGNLYGTTLVSGGAVTGGSVFELSPPISRGDSWTLATLYSFCQQGGNACSDGSWPSGGLVFDALGNLYGTTEMGGLGNWGTVYELSPNSDGGWTEIVLYKFLGGIAGQPTGPVSFDSAGDMYGTLDYGGSGEAGYCTENHGGHARCGGLFRLSPKPGGSYGEFTFPFDGPDGGNPVGNVLPESNGTVYGATESGGEYFAGAFFGIQGKKENLLYSWNCNVEPCAGGASPSYLTLHRGSFYGGASQGGEFDQGVVFEISP
jgi:uncharacterized repeat protein (TIGR03803 family)